MTVMNTGPEKPVERDESPVGLLGGLVVALIIFLAVVGFAVQAGLGKLVEHREVEIGYGSPGAELTESRHRDHARLSNYEVSDESRGLYQVPVDKAIDLLVDGKTLDLDGALAR